MEIEYTPRGVCSRHIHVDVEDGTIREVKFTGGCSGNTQGVAALAQGMKVEDYIARCKDIKCGHKPTSCPPSWPWPWSRPCSPRPEQIYRK